MGAVMDYVIACKNAPTHYHWSIQNYHVEHYTDENGVSRSRDVNTHFARTGGELTSTDVTPPFQPNVTKSRVALKSDVEAEPDEAFKQEYERRRQMFYAANTTDRHQWKRVWYTVKGQKPTVKVAWVDQEDPWYADSCVLCLMSLTPFTAVLWLSYMDSYLGKQKVTFKKTFSGFVAPPKTPKKLRDIAANSTASFFAGGR